MAEITLLASGVCGTELNCPAVYELPNGDLAVIGKSAPDELHTQLPQGP